MQPTPNDAPPEPDRTDRGFSPPGTAVAPPPQQSPQGAETWPAQRAAPEPGARTQEPGAPEGGAWPPPQPVRDLQPSFGYARGPIAPEVGPPAPAVYRPASTGSRFGHLTRFAPAIAAVSVLLLLFTTYQAWSLSGRVADLDDRLRVVTNDNLDLRGRVIPLENRAGQWLDAVTVAKNAAPAVFTIVAGRSLGTGFGFYGDGKVTYIATNYHVVAAAAEHHDRVAIYQGDKKWLGTTENWDRNSDVALIRVDEDLPILQSAYGQGHDPALGDPVLAFGSPEGLEGTATEGIISAIRQGWIQTDAQINPGNSGGPLLNSYGEVIGLTAVGIGGGGSGLGFAVNIREVCALAGDHTC